MKININNHDCTELWNGVLYKALSDYPKVNDNEMKDIIDFISYNKAYGRNIEIESDNPEIIVYVKAEIKNSDKYKNVSRPKLITECTACPVEKGCDTEFVCHTAPLENAIEIFRCGKLLSAVNARKLPVKELMKESRNAANDTADMFEYVMLAWGNCQAGDRLVTERAIKRLPTADDLGLNFIAGIRFFFEYSKLDKHPDAIHDGFLPIKIKNEIILADWLFAVVVPQEYRQIIEPYIPQNLKDKVYFISRNGEDIWQWSEKVFKFIKTLK